MELDTSVDLRTIVNLTVESTLKAEDFAKNVYSLLHPIYGKRLHSLGFGRIVADYSDFLRTRYVLVDIYEDEMGKGEGSSGTFSYKILVKSGSKAGRMADVLYAFLVILAFWLLKNFIADRNVWTAIGLTLTAGVGAALYIFQNRKGFGENEAQAMTASLRKIL